VLVSEARCKWFAYGSADATATPSSLASSKYRIVLPFGCPLKNVVPKERLLKLLRIIYLMFADMNSIRTIWHILEYAITPPSSLGMWILLNKIVAIYPSPLSECINPNQSTVSCKVSRSSVHRTHVKINQVHFILLLQTTAPCLILIAPYNSVHWNVSYYYPQTMSALTHV